MHSFFAVRFICTQFKKSKWIADKDGVIQCSEDLCNFTTCHKTPGRH